jgi:hypothetical protein
MATPARRDADFRNRIGKYESPQQLDKQGPKAATGCRQAIPTPANALLTTLSGVRCTSFAERVKNFRQRVQWELSGIKNCGLRVGHGSGRLLWLPQCVRINHQQLPIVVYKESVMRIAIFGAGGLGGYFGARLARSKAEVIFIARGEHLDAIREKGLRVDSISGDFVVFPAQATDDPAEIGTVDVVILGVKAWQVNTVLPALRPLIGPETTIVPLQNGVEAPYQLVQAFGAKNVVGGLAKIISFKVGAGHIRHAGADPYIAIGELDKGPGERTQRDRNGWAPPRIVHYSATTSALNLW